MKNIVIIGATSGIAEAVARQYAKQGANLFLLARDAGRLQLVKDDLIVRGAAKVSIQKFDLMEVKTFSALVADVISDLKQIDLVLMAPGSLPDQEACEADPELLIQQVTLNGTSCIALSQLFANALKNQGCGSIAIISSPAGDRGRQSNYIYGASKAALTVFAQGLRNKMVQYGVHVLTIKPGFVITAMTNSFDRSGFLWVKPEKIAGDIINAVERKKDSIYTPRIWFWIMLVIKSIPEGIFKKLKL